MNEEAYQGFIQGAQQLGSMARPVEMPDEQRVKNARDIYLANLDGAMAVDLESCVHCGMCAEACHFYVSTKDPKYTPIRKLDLLKRIYRRELSPMRWLHRLYTRDITVDDLREFEELVYDSCTECGRCSTICPMGIHIAGMVNVNRQAMTAAGLGPAELRAMDQEQCDHESVFGVGKDQFLAALENLREQGLDVPLDKPKAEVMITTSVLDIALTVDALVSTVKIMNHTGRDWTFRSEGYESANFGMLLGDEETQACASRKLIDAAVACEAKIVVTAECGHGYTAMRWDSANSYGKPLPFKVMAISEFMGNEIREGRLKLKKLDKKVVAWHDPCKVGRIGGSFQEPRDVIEALGLELHETESSGPTNFCCGGGAGVFLINRAADLRHKAFQLKQNEIDNTGAKTMIVSCGSCRMNFENGKHRSNWDMSIESLVELVGENLDESA
ncbi:MAG: (Fe-S)-binding protein [Gammaproteobacteria bacterium]|nr:MAG: (Fe-S)-binding protein [Gammaproteobacteria bacterium]